MALQNAVFENLVVAVFKKNNKNRYFVPSENNLIAGINFRFIMMDYGCSILCPIVGGHAEIQNMKTKFPNNQYAWSFASGEGVSSTNVVLKIKSRDPMFRFPVQLAVDLGGGVFTVPYLRFFLCGEDLAHLSKFRNQSAPAGCSDMFSDEDKALLYIHRQNLSTRRSHVLFGRSMHSEHRTYDAFDFIYVLAANRHLTVTLLASIVNSTTQRALASSTLASQPEGFDLLDDEDRVDGHSESENEYGDDYGQGGDTGDEYED